MIIELIKVPDHITKTECYFIWRSEMDLGKNVMQCFVFNQYESIESVINIPFKEILEFIDNGKMTEWINIKGNHIILTNK